MDHTLQRLRSSTQIGIAIAAVHVAAQDAREARALKISTQLGDLAEELIYLHRQLLELPPQATPAACEFERTDLSEHPPPF